MTDLDLKDLRINEQLKYIFFQARTLGVNKDVMVVSKRTDGLTHLSDLGVIVTLPQLYSLFRLSVNILLQ